MDSGKECPILRGGVPLEGTISLDSPKFYCGFGYSECDEWPNFNNKAICPHGGKYNRKATLTNAGIASVAKSGLNQCAGENCCSHGASGFNIVLNGKGAKYWTCAV